MSDTFNWNFDTWEVIKNFLNHQNGGHCVAHQIESYNTFIDSYLPECVKQNNPITLSYLDKDKKYEIGVTFDEIYLMPAIIHENDGSTKKMQPEEARLRNFTYSSDLYTDITIRCKVDGNETKKKLSKISLGKIPVMLKSKLCILNNINTVEKQYECKFDLGGYFIINGSEKAVVSQERRAENRIYVCKNVKSQAKYSCVAECHSVPTGRILTPKSVQVKIMSKGTLRGKQIKVSIPHIRQDIPLSVIFKCLGVVKDKQILEYIVNDINNPANIEYINIIRTSLEDENEIKTQDEAYEYISKYVILTGYYSYYKDKDKIDIAKKISIVKEIIKNDLLPHIGQNINRKCIFLGIITFKMLKVYLGYRGYDDRDSMLNKRIDTPGVLMANLFRVNFNKLIKDMKIQINKEFINGSWKAMDTFGEIINDTNIYKLIKSSTITTGLKYALATGNWGLKNIVNKQGIAQVLNRLTYNSSLSHLRRVNTPIEKTGKLIGPRKLHNTQWMCMCPHETPEGGSVGIVKNMALTTYITNYSNPQPIIRILGETDHVKNIDDCSPTELFNVTKIFVNGDINFITNEPEKIINYYKSNRRKGIINIYSSISWLIDDNVIEIYTDAGRCTRPLYILDNNSLRITKNEFNMLKNGEINWNHLLLPDLNPSHYVNNYDNESCIEFIDSNEQNNCMIAIDNSKLKNLDEKVIKYKYTHLELHPSLMLGVLASCIPFSDRNQAPRNLFQCAMGKQAMGVYATNFRFRMDTLAHILSYPQQPIVNSRLVNYLPSSDLPSGINAIVAIASHSGYNQEDSLIFNKSAVQRGFFNSTFYRCYKDEERKSQSSGDEEKFCYPDMTTTRGTKMGNYTKLGENGFIIKDEFVQENDIIIGKVIPIKNKKTGEAFYKDSSTSIRPNEAGYVDGVKISRNGDGYRFGKIKIRTSRYPTIGDKHSSRHGQKGTIGMIYNQEDMPFTKEGICPDIIVNPHAIPSRMTIGQLIECITAKSGAITGRFADATPFKEFNREEIENVLKNNGYDKHGNEILYNPRTGEQLKVNIFIGPTQYQRLRHMVLDKIHSRATGPYVTLTRQPLEGRSRDGGLRFGEMERDCMLSHGASLFLKETLLDRSDNFRIYVCKKCGMIPIANPDKNIYMCNNCNSFTNFSELRIPYAMKLFLQEIQCMSIAPRMIT